jgi:hypothetical protein
MQETVAAVRNPCASCQSLSLVLTQDALAQKLQEKEQMCRQSIKYTISSRKPKQNLTAREKKRRKIY